MTYQPPPGDPNQWGSSPPPPHWQPIAPQQPPVKNQNVTLFVVLGVVLALLIGGGVVAGVFFLTNARENGSTVTKPKADVRDGGIVLGEGKPQVTIYLDFICPACANFHEQNGDLLREAVETGKATVIMHPLGFLDNASSTDYSSRAAAASVCAADEGKFFDYYSTLMDNQPPEGGEGLSDEKLAGLGSDAGIGGDFSGCVGDGTYRGWIERRTKNAEDDGIASTPTVRIDGAEVPAAEFKEKFAQATA